MKATYNITSNRFKVWFDDRLSPEDYKRAKECNFVWYPGQKCFSSIWYPQAEDFIKSFGIEIEEDDTPDDLESRVNRFEKYAERAESDSENAADYARRDDITARRAEAAEKRAQTEAEKAEHWKRRIAGAIAHAQYKDRPDVIARRIKDLEKQQKKHVSNKDKDPQKYAAMLKEHPYTKDETPERHAERVAQFAAAVEFSRRWYDHLEKRLQYERAYLEAVGGSPVDKLANIKAGDPVMYEGRLYRAAKVNKTTIQLTSYTPPADPTAYQYYPIGAKIDKTKLQPAEV